jgi:glycosyltransferase involved in cell wall biosynthesis
MPKKIVISVISDLVTDQRVMKVTNSLYQNNYSVLLIGSRHKKSLELNKRDYPTKRIFLFFEKRFLKYAEWNLKLFFYLFFHKADILLANDLDTLLPNFLHSKLRRIQLVYDSHEYFTEQMEVTYRKYVKKVWTKLEQFIFPKLKNVYTVNESIAGIYTKKYNVPVQVIRNVPIYIKKEITQEINLDLTFFKNKKILLSQGTGINSNRGYEELILSMLYLTNEYCLVIIGSGLVIESLKNLVKENSLENKVVFLEKMIPAQLRQVTKLAFCGFTLDKPLCLNYYYILPNKLFDFIAAEIPIIASNMVEVETIVNEYEIGIVLEEMNSKNIADAVMHLNANASFYEKCKKNTVRAYQDLNWQNEEKKLLSIFEKL